MRRLMVVAVLLLCLPMVGEGQSIRYHPDLSTLTLGKPTSASIRFHPAIASGSTLLTGLVSYWPLDEESGTRYDAVGGNDLTDNNTVGFDTGVDGAAASFVAANSEYLSRAAITELGSPLSLGFWLNPADTARRVLFANGETNVTAGMLMESSVNGAGDINVFLNSALDSYAYTGAGVLTVGAWHHVIFTFDGGIPKMYVNNVEKALTVVGVPASSLPYGNNFYIGAGPETSRYANGLIDEVAIWDRVLTSDERAELYNAGAGKFYPF